MWLDSIRTASRAIQWGNASLSARYSGAVGATRLEITGALADFRARLPVSGPATPLAEGTSRRARLSADAVSRTETLALRYGVSVEEQRQSYRVRVAAPRVPTPWGELVVHASGGRLSAVNHLSLERYLYGVVPDEMPPSWHPEALKAQAVVAREASIRR